jgi:hypothetical protein
MTRRDLLAWASREREEALRQIDLFETAGLKAQLLMPDGSTQDITAGVVAHQTENAAAYEQLIAVLGADP